MGSNKHSSNFGLDGVSLLRRDISKLSAALDVDETGREIAGRILSNAAEPILTYAKAHTDEQRTASSPYKDDPYKITGDLHEALKKSKLRKSKKSGRVFVSVGVHRQDWVKHLAQKPNEYYPAYVEYGHGGPRPAPAHPYLRPAYDTNEEKAYDEIRDQLARVIDENF